MKGITEELLAKFRESYECDEKAKVLHSALAKTPMMDLAYDVSEGALLKGPFTIEVKTKGITAQEQSGRCWLFAALNILREKVAERCHLEQFELSQNYLSFYDKLEKANNFLEMVIENPKAPIKGQLMQYVLRGMTDGGYWSEAVDLIEKYGVVPKQVQPETYQSGHTDRFTDTLNRLLRKDALELRRLVSEGKNPYPRKEEMMGEVYRAECIAFGRPVETFDFTYRDKDNQFHEDRHLTPREFYKKYVGISLRDYMAVINEPTFDKPVGRVIAFHAVENMTGHDMKGLNLTQKEMEDLCIAQLKAGEAIWFACDAGAAGARKDGVWDPRTVRYEDLLGGFSTAMEKGKRLEYSASSANHAMLLTGVHLDEEGKPDRWKIENSWGKDVGDNGYFVCSEDYFREFVYEAVILKKHFNQEQQEMMKKEPVYINAWDEDY